MTRQYHPISEDNFDYAQSLGVKDAITDQFAYDRACARGLTLADWVIKNSDVVPDPVAIRAVHCAIFSNIHDWAGELREPGSKEIYLAGVLPGDPPSKLDDRLRLLCEWSKEDFAWAGENPERQVQAIASFHVALKRIQAFPDGSGRTAGVIMEHQVEKCFEQQLGVALANSYGKALVDALFTGEVKELAEGLAHALKVTPQSQSPDSDAAAQKDQVWEQRLQTHQRHTLVHERLEALRVAEDASVATTHNAKDLRVQRQAVIAEAAAMARADWLALAAAEKATDDGKVQGALDDLKRNPLEVSPENRRQQEARLSGKEDSREAVERRAQRAVRELEAMQHNKEHETRSHSHSQSD